MPARLTAGIILPGRHESADQIERGKRTMKKRVLSILLALCMLIGLLPMLPALAAEGDLPEKLYIAPTAEGNIPSQIDVYPDPSGGQNQYHLYLPGNAAAGSCFLSWENGLSASMGGRTYASGALPIPAPGETETVTFTKGPTTKTFNILTYQGSEAVHPIFFELDESQGTIAAMLENKNNTCTGSVVIDGNKYALDTIKGRGNATWRDDKEKKPFNFKLAKTEKKLQLPWIDCEKTRKWTLLSNVNDRTLLRNKVAYDLAHQMGIGFDSAAVDIWLNGAYWGTYQLTPKTDAYVTDDGFLLEDNNIVDDEDPSFNMGNMIINIKEMGDNLIIAEGGDPDNPSSQSIQAVKSKIQSYFQDVWNALSASNGVNSKGKHYSDYFDVDSMAKFYLLHEFIKNLEVDGGSIFLTRDGMTDTDKLIAGPAWDYDNSMGYNGSNGNMAAGGSGWPRNAPLNYASLSVGNWYITGRNRGKLFGTFSKHQDFLDKTYEVYNQYYTLFDDVQQNVRRQAALIEDSAEMNFVRTVKEDKNNFDFPSHNTKFDEGTPYEVNYKEAQVWSEYVDNLVTYTSGRAKWFHDQMYVENTCEHDYQADVTEPTCTTDGYTTYTCTKCGDSYIGNVITAPGHNFEDGVCTRCGTRAMTVTFYCGEGATVTVHKTQENDSEVFENVTVAYPRSSTTGEIDVSGDGQVNFVVNVADGYRLDTVSADPPTNYKNLKGPDETLVDNGYRLTKVVGNVNVIVTTEEVGPCEHEYKAEVTAPTCTAQGFTTYTCTKCGDSYVGGYTAKLPHNYVDGVCAVCGEKLLNVTIEAGEGASVTVLETQKADGPKTENATSANPRDGASGLIDCSGEGQVNFIVNLAEGYSLESVTAAPAGSYKNLKGPTDTGIASGYRITKVTGDFTITVKTKKNGEPACEHDYQAVVTAPTCINKGYTTYTCSKCGDSYTGNEVDALGHDYKAADQPEPTCAGFVTVVYTCTRCGDSFTEEIAPMPHDYKAVVTAPTCTDKGYTTYTCSRCGDSYTGDEVAALQHNYVDGVCTRCGAVDPDYVPPADKGELDKAIKDAALYPEDDYTPESYASLTAAVAAAQPVMDKEDATQEEVDAAAQAVKDAIAGLEKKPDALDKGALIAAISAAEALKPEEYTEKSAKDLADAITAARDALSNAADQDAIDAAVAALKGVVDNLEKKPTFLFDDVKDPNKFYFDPVYWAYYAEPQITKGTDDTHFGPDNACTRGHVVTFLWRAAGEPAPKSTQTPFTDLKPGAFYEKAVAWAVEEGITKGLSDTAFGPDATCTRGQIVTFLWRFKDEPAPKSTQTPFTDVNPNGYYMKAVAWAVENEVTKGLSDTTFGPDATCTRGQVVTFLFRATAE